MFYREDDRRMSDGDLYYTAGVGAVVERWRDDALLGLARLAVRGVAICARGIFNLGVYGFNTLWTVGNNAINRVRHAQPEVITEVDNADNVPDVQIVPVVPEVVLPEPRSFIISQAVVDGLKARALNVGIDVDAVPARTLRSGNKY